MYELFLNVASESSEGWDGGPHWIPVSRTKAWTLQMPEIQMSEVCDSYMWNLKYDTNELIYKTETDSQTQKTNLWLPKGKWGREEG